MTQEERIQEFNDLLKEASDQSQSNIEIDFSYIFIILFLTILS